MISQLLKRRRRVRSTFLALRICSVYAVMRVVKTLVNAWSTIEDFTCCETRKCCGDTFQVKPTFYRYIEIRRLPCNILHIFLLAKILLELISMGFGEAGRHAHPSSWAKRHGCETRKC